MVLVVDRVGVSVASMGVAAVVVAVVGVGAAVAEEAKVTLASAAVDVEGGDALVLEHNPMFRSR